jgi:hypothetical protein
LALEAVGAGARLDEERVAVEVAVKGWAAAPSVNWPVRLVPVSAARKGKVLPERVRVPAYLVASAGGDGDRQAFVAEGAGDVGGARDAGQDEEQQCCGTEQRARGHRGLPWS